MFVIATHKVANEQRRSHQEEQMKSRQHYTEYPKRNCKSLHFCELCRQDITFGQDYYDGGYGYRAHDLCAEADRLELNEMAKELEK